jgi:hypothetical protein
MKLAKIIVIVTIKNKDKNTNKRTYLKKTRVVIWKNILYGWLVVWLVDWLVVWLVRWSVGWLVDWLVGW